MKKKTQGEINCLNQCGDVKRKPRKKKETKIDKLAKAFTSLTDAWINLNGIDEFASDSKVLNDIRMRIGNATLKEAGNKFSI